MPPHYREMPFILFTEVTGARHENIFQGAEAPSGAGPPHVRVIRITLRHTTSVGLLWTSDQPDAENSTWQNTTF